MTISPMPDPLDQLPFGRRIALGLQGLGASLAGRDGPGVLQDRRDLLERESRKRNIAGLMERMGIADDRRALLEQLPLESQAEYLIEHMNRPAPLPPLGGGGSVVGGRAISPVMTEGQAIAGDAMQAIGVRHPMADAVASVESAGSGGYSAIGPVTRDGDRAYGRYQVMGANVGPWTEKYVGRRMTPEEFLNDPRAQEAVFAGEFQSYLDQYGTVEDAASMWFSGRPYAGNMRSDGYNTVPEYVQKVSTAAGGAAPGATPGTGQNTGALLQRLNLLRARDQQLIDNADPRDPNLPAYKARVATIDQQIERLTADDPIAALRARYQFARESGMPHEQALAWSRSGSTVNVTNIPTPPAGYRNVFGDDGNVIGQEPIPGGPADFERQQEEEEAAAEAAEISAAKAEEMANKYIESDVVVQTVGEIRAILDEPKMFDLPETGIVGERLGRWGISQDAVDVRNKVNTLKASIAFSRLQAMRDASPTGGALGPVSNLEIGLLASTLGSLEQSTSEPEFRRILNRVEEIYTGIMRKFAADPNLNMEDFMTGEGADGNDPLGLR